MQAPRRFRARGTSGWMTCAACTGGKHLARVGLGRSAEGDTLSRPTPRLTVTMRAILLILALIPYLYYGGRDAVFHFVGRRVSVVEHLLHLVIGCMLVAAVAQAFRGNQGRML